MEEDKPNRHLAGGYPRRAVGHGSKRRCQHQRSENGRRHRHGDREIGHAHRHLLLLLPGQSLQRIVVPTEFAVLFLKRNRQKRVPRTEKPFPYSESQLRRLWDEDVATMAESVKDFDRLTFHCARHGFATKMLRDGKDQDGFRIGRLGRYRFAHENLCARNPRCTADRGRSCRRADGTVRLAHSRLSGWLRRTP